MSAQKKLNQSNDLKRIMTKKKISADDLARALKVTTQTVYNLRRGNASEQLFDHAFIIVDKWEASK
jgi:DNA-binding Xre family transcriptional regulator